jgi:hypothetical protein
MSRGISMHILKHGGRPARLPPPIPPTAVVPHTCPEEINVVRRERLGYARAFRFEVAEDVMLKEVMAQLKCSLGAGTLKLLLRKLFACQEEAIFEASVLSVSESGQKRTRPVADFRTRLLPELIPIPRAAWL